MLVCGLEADIYDEEYNNKKYFGLSKHFPDIWNSSCRGEKKIIHTCIHTYIIKRKFRDHTALKMFNFSYWLEKFL